MGRGTLRPSISHADPESTRGQAGPELTYRRLRLAPGALGWPSGPPRDRAPHPGARPRPGHRGAGACDGAYSWGVCVTSASRRGEIENADGWRASLSAKTLHPLAEGEVGGDDRRAPLVAVGEEVQEQLAAAALEGHEAERVDDQPARLAVREACTPCAGRWLPPPPRPDSASTRLGRPSVRARAGRSSPRFGAGPHGPWRADRTWGAWRDLEGLLRPQARRGEKTQRRSHLPRAPALRRHPGQTIEARNRAFHRMLVEGVTVEYRTDGGAIRGAQGRRHRLRQPRRQRLPRGQPGHGVLAADLDRAFTGAGWTYQPSA